MNTTIDIPEPLLRQAEVVAIQRGVTLKNLLVSALRNEVGEVQPVARTGPRTMGSLEGFGALRHLHEETTRINHVIEEEFEYHPSAS